MNIIRLKAVYFLLLIILYYLLNAYDCNALMSADRERETGTFVIMQDRDSNMNRGIRQTGYDVLPPEVDTKVDTVVSEEDNAAVENKIKEEVDKIKEEKRKIVEETIEQKEASPPFPDRMKPYVAEESSVISDREKPKKEGILPLEKHNTAITENPFLFFLVLLALSVVIYYIYVFTFCRK